MTIIRARWTEGVGKGRFLHCRPGHSGIGEHETQPEALWEKQNKDRQQGKYTSLARRIPCGVVGFA